MPKSVLKEVVEAVETISVEIVGRRVTWRQIVQNLKCVGVAEKKDM